MSGYIVRRLAGAVPVLLGVTAVAFLLLHLVPGDPIRLMLGFRASQEQVDQVRAAYGLDRPLLDQYVAYLGRLVTLDLGRSIVQKVPVIDLVGDRMWPSLLIIGYATTISVLIGVPLAIVAALRRGRLADLVVRIASMISFATPAFLVGVLLILVFALAARVVPTSGYQRDPVGIIRTLTLPALAIGLYLAPMLIRTLRVSLIEAYGSDHVMASRARGLGPNVVARQALRNSLVPTIALLGVNLGYLLGGAVVIETLFAVPGLGSLLVSSVLARDLPVVQAISLLFALAVILINLGTDVLNATLDPPDASVIAPEAQLIGSIDAAARPPRWSGWSIEVWIGVAILALIVLASLLAPLLRLPDPEVPDYTAALRAPSLAHLMGTDPIGRDILSRVLAAARLDLSVGVVTTFIPLVVGMVLGALAGYLGGLVEIVAMRATDVVIAFPFLVLVLAIVAVVGPGLQGAVIGLLVVSWAIYARLSFAEMRRLRDQPYLLAAEGLGFSPARVLGRHAMPALLRVNLAFSPTDLVINILVLASLSFVGAGVDPQSAEWGAMIAAGQSYLLTAWWVSVMPGVAIVVTGVAFVLIGDGLVDRVTRQTAR